MNRQVLGFSLIELLMAMTVSLVMLEYVLADLGIAKREESRAQRIMCNAS